MGSDVTGNPPTNQTRLLVTFRLIWVIIGEFWMLAVCLFNINSQPIAQCWHNILEMSISRGLWWAVLVLTCG